MDFYQILQSIMDEKGMTVAAVARVCGLSDGTVRSIVTRKQKNVALEVAFKLSDGLGVSLERLNGMPEKESPSTAQAAPGDETVSTEEVERLLLDLGILKEGRDLTDDDVSFIGHIIGILDAWFSE